MRSVRCFSSPGVCGPRSISTASTTSSASERPSASSSRCRYLSARLLAPQLVEDRGHVRLDGLRAEEELRADARIRAALGHQPENPALSRAQLVDRIVPAAVADELRDDLRIHCGAAARDASHRLDEL